MAITRATVLSYLETRNEEAVPVYAKEYMIWQIPDSKSWDGENLIYNLAERPGGGFGLVGTDNAVNTTGTGKNLSHYNLALAKAFATIQIGEEVLALEKAGALKKIGKYAQDCEADWLQHADIISCGNADGVIAKHATGTNGTATLTGVTGLHGDTYLQPQWVWKGQRVQVGTGGTKENHVISSVVWDGAGTKTCTITLSANLANDQTDVSLYVFGTGTTGTVVWPGILAMCSASNTLGVSPNTLDRSTAANAQFRATVGDKDSMGINWADDPVGVIEAFISAANGRARGRGEINLIFPNPKHLAFIRKKLKSQVRYNGKKVFGLPVLDEIIPGVDFVDKNYAWPFGYLCGVCREELDRPTLIEPRWLVGTDREFLRKTGYVESEAVFGGMFYTAQRNPGLGIQINGLTGNELETPYNSA